VALYLQAAVGENEQAVERVRRFFAPRASWNPGQELTIVRVIGRPSQTSQGPGRYRVTVRMQQVGTMSPTGAVDPGGVDPSPFTAEFIVVGRGTPAQWRLESAAPDGLMLSDAALETLYQPSPVYFWNLERTQLVPDMRYVPLTMDVNERLNQVVEWQLGGPSTWLGPAVFHRQNVKLKGRVAVSGGAVVVNLSSSAGDDRAELQGLTDQLRWTLRTYVTRPLELRVEGQRQNVQGAGDGYLAKNAAAVNREPALFSVQGEARKVVVKRGSGPVRVLDVKENANVSYAAVSPYPHDVAAFVGAKRRKLTIIRTGTKEEERGKIAAIEVNGLPGTIGRPVWIPGPGSEQFLVPANGQLWVVDTKGKLAPIRPSGIGAVGSVSISPDGRRVALAAGGRAFVGALQVSEKGATVKIGSQLRELVPDRMTVNAVAWASENKVLVAGANAADKAALFRVSADGAVATDESPDEAALLDVIAFPGPTGAGDIVASTAGAVFYVFSRDTVPATDLTFPFYAG
jgi:hypothetical protein